MCDRHFWIVKWMILFVCLFVHWTMFKSEILNDHSRTAILLFFKNALRNYRVLYKSAYNYLIFDVCFHFISFYVFLLLFGWYLFFIFFLYHLSNNSCSIFERKFDGQKQQTLGVPILPNKIKAKTTKWYNEK